MQIQQLEIQNLHLIKKYGRSLKDLSTNPSPNPN